MAGAAGAALVVLAAVAGADPLDEWEVARGLALSVHSRPGLRLPTALAMVPEPGPGASDVRYYVAELGGRIMAVANDGTAATFAERWFPAPPDRNRSGVDDPYGLVGLCLAPDEGYVFATYSHLDAERRMHNRVARFTVRPRTFAPRSGERREIVDLPGRVTRDMHQIGACRVSQGQLYFGVGDGGFHGDSRVPASPAGKVHRTDLDGRPVADNPFREHGAATSVFAVGFRNPFGLSVVGGRVFVADNGIDVDRFLEVGRGDDALWDGTDGSIGARADAVFAPTLCPTHLDHAGGTPLRGTGTFVVGAVGDVGEPAGGGPRSDAALVAIPYDLTARRMTGSPTVLAQGREGRRQRVSALAAAPDGVYFAPLLSRDGGAVLRLSADGPAHAHVIGGPGERLDRRLEHCGCLDCHSYLDRPSGRRDNIHPSMVVPALRDRLHAPAYLEALERADRDPRDPLPQWRDARAAVRAAQGDERVRLWLRYRLLEPRFDDPLANMPALGFTEAEADDLATRLVTAAQETRWGALRRSWRLGVQELPPARHRHLLVAFGLGAAAALGAVVAWRRGRRAALSSPRDGGPALP